MSMSITLVAHFYDYYPFFNSLYLFSRTLLELALQLCVAVKTLYLMSIYTGTMRLNLMFHHWDHCCGARGRGRDNHWSALPGV